MRSLTIRRPDDWHLHLRDGAMMEGVIGDTSRHFARAIIMPNLVPPVVTTADARAYRERIVKAIPAGDTFEPLMTLYLTEGTNPDDLEEGKTSGLIPPVPRPIPMAACVISKRQCRRSSAWRRSVCRSAFMVK
jgi:dihydroorotase